MTISGLTTMNRAMGILMTWWTNQTMRMGSDGLAAVNWGMLMDANRPNIKLVSIRFGTRRLSLYLSQRLVAENERQRRRCGSQYRRDVRTTINDLMSMTI
jgi:hypothetical protein